MKSTLVYILCTASLLILLTPATAQADMFRFWAAARGDSLSGTGAGFDDLQQPFGAGLELGLEFAYISTSFDFVFMGSDQYMIANHTGFDTSYKITERVRMYGGLTTGPVFLKVPYQGPRTTFLDNLAADQLDALQNFVDSSSEFDTVEAVESLLGEYSLSAQYQKIIDAEESLNESAFGWNVARLRLGADVELTKRLYLGASASLAYHVMISGAQTNSAAKSLLIDSYAKEFNIPDDARDVIREGLGVQDDQKSSLSGWNYGGNVYIKYEYSLETWDDFKAALGF